eukprot:SAG31_NODE_41_length_31342_cov_8.029286_14_plen_111_part_00
MAAVADGPSPLHAAKIQRIVDMGFPAEAAERAIAAADGNLHAAAELLFVNPGVSPGAADQVPAPQPAPNARQQPAEHNVLRIVELGFTELAAKVCHESTQSFVRHNFSLP